MCALTNYTIIDIDFRDLNISPKELYRTMGYGDAIPDAKTLATLDVLMQRVAEIAKPRAMYHMYKCSFNDQYIEIEEHLFDVGKTIQTLLRNSEWIAVFVATVGVEVDELIKEVHLINDPIESFILDAIGSTVVEAVGDYMQDVLSRDIVPKKNTNRVSPGYCGWHVAEQQKLFSLLPSLPCGIELTDSSLMIPIKSISGFVGVGDNVKPKVYGCATCNQINCYLKRT